MNTAKAASSSKSTQKTRRLKRGNLKVEPMRLRGGKRERASGWFVPALNPPLKTAKAA